jgi:hypothetical protein
MNTEPSLSTSLPNRSNRPKAQPRVNAAVQDFEDSTADVANLATAFLDQWGIAISLAMCRESPELAEDLNELQAAARTRYERQETFLRPCRMLTAALPAP